MTRVIQLPNGRTVTLRAYCAAWRALRLMHPRANVGGWGHFSETAADVLRAMSYGVHDRINRHIPGFNRGRKWSADWQRAAVYTARLINGNRVILDHAPRELCGRLAHRMRERNAA